MISRVSLAVGGVVGLIFGLLLFHLVNVAVWLPAARDEGRELERAASLKRSIEIIQQRSKTNADVSKLDSRSLCVELGGVWVPENSLCE